MRFTRPRPADPSQTDRIVPYRVRALGRPTELSRLPCRERDLVLQFHWQVMTLPHVVRRKSKREIRPIGQPDLNRIAAECIASRSRMVSRVLTKIYDDELRPLGLTVGQFGLLVASGYAGVLRPRDFADAWCIDASTVSRNIERLRARGWLEIVPDEDAREQPVQLSSSGWAVVRKASLPWERAQSEAIRLLGRGGVSMLRAISDELGTPRPRGRNGS